MRARRALVLALGALGGGCAYDWSVAPPGGGSDAGLVDASPGEAAPLDGGVDGGGLDAFVEAGGDQGARDSGPDCPGLAADLAAARAAAVSCVATNLDACKTAVKDECGCDLVVYLPDSGTDGDYAAAVAALLGAGCKPSCPGCSSPSFGMCLYLDGGTGGTTCYQHP